jgi:hypothetical protein
VEQRRVQFGLSMQIWRIKHSLRFVHRLGMRPAADLSLETVRARISLEIVDVLLLSSAAIFFSETPPFSQFSIKIRSSTFKCLFLAMKKPSKNGIRKAHPLFWRITEAFAL